MSNKERILLVEDDDDMRESCREALEMASYIVLEANSARAAEPILYEHPIDLVVTDLRMADGGGEEVLRTTKAVTPGTPVLVVTAYPTVESTIEAFRGGVADYLLKPFTDPQLIEAVDRALAARRADDRASLLRRLGAGDPDMPHMIGASPAFRAMLAEIRRFAPLEGAVLIAGETGSGKELVARAVHALSRRAAGPFLVLNCAAVPENLIESELFGYEKGAFTGAVSAKPGLFEAASGGSLFLDEVADLSLTAQAKLLRCLEERAVRRVGSLRARPADVRIIAATHKDLRALVRAERFREDLLYRLAVLEVRAPALRERPEDIPMLAVHFLDRLREETGRELLGFDESAIAKLVSYGWPGNVRELQNVVQKAFALSGPMLITAADVPLRVEPQREPDAAPLTNAIDAFEHDHVLSALKAHQGNVTHTAKALGIHRTTLQRLVKRLGISVEER